ncbi:MAG: hypothetical protein RMM10_12470 [Anaerolineae bacterium]|uniref:hypothetical protein n=1 Tax=Thermoflexus sp. TaxID=1969742 RepID=UPI0025DA6B6A|nr:hypothetical protein [Thermoflexus sp.]MCS7352311.1 hypothetical protein [Thermoflexus sp.]MDW8181774.1 hypothetical protein [Anaerolineae bacterium]
MLRLSVVVTRRAGHGFLWGTAPPFHLEELADALRRRGEEILRVGLVEIVFAFPEWTRPHRVIPRQVLTERGLRIREPWTPFWLIRFGYEEPRADVEGVTLEGEPVHLLVRDLDLDAVEAYVAAPGWLRCAAGVWVEVGASLQRRSDVAEEEWAAAWLRAGLRGENGHAFEEILQEAARRGISWGVFYREREVRFDLTSRHQIEGVLLLARVLRRHIVKVPDLTMGMEIPEEA